MSSCPVARRDFWGTTGQDDIFNYIHLDGHVNSGPYPVSDNWGLPFQPSQDPGLNLHVDFGSLNRVWGFCGKQNDVSSFVRARNKPR